MLRLINGKLNSSLRLRISATFIGLILAIGVVVLTSFTFLTTRQVERTVQKDVEATASLIRHLIAERAADLESRTTLIAQLPTIQSAILNARDKDTVADRAEYYLPKLNADGLVIADRDAQILASVGCASRSSDQQSSKPFLEKALEGTPVKGVIEFDNRMMLITAVPIRVSEFVQGALLAYSEVGTDFARKLSDTLSTDVAFTLGGTTVASSKPIPPGLDLRAPSPKRITIAGVEYVALEGSQSASPASAPVKFVVLHRRSALIENFEQLNQTFVLIILGSILVAVILSGRLSAKVTRPLEQIAAAATKLRSGEWPEKLDEASQSEIGILNITFNEMTESLRESQQKLLAMIDLDPLTQLDNHRRFKENIAQETARGLASGNPVSLLLLDLDGFSKINEQKGHAAGDELLKSVAELMKTEAPDYALLARHSGDGFAMILPLTPLEKACDFAETLQFSIYNRLALSCCIGCAEAGPSTLTGESLCLAAEVALTRAKMIGTNQIARFDRIPGAENSDPYQLSQYLQDASIATIQALAAAVDAKDAYTRGHSQRVAEFASWLCEYLGGNKEEVELTYRTGTLHDVGKIGVPDHILNKQSNLTDEERAIVETHPVLGEVIVKKVPQLADALSGVRSHHERWDGNGYPDGLAGTAISRLARMIAIADTYDAMTSDRPYRKGLDMDTALQEIVKGAGTQFDPYLATSFAKMMWERGESERVA